VELVVNPEVIARGGQSVRRQAEAEGIEILSVHPTVVPLPGWWERRGGAEPTIRLAREADAELVVTHVPRFENLDEGHGLAYRRRIEAWQLELAGSGLRLAIENKAVRAETDWRYALTPLDRLRAFADRFDLGLVLDTTHAGTADQDLWHARQMFDRRLVNVHLSDVGGWVPLDGWPYVQRLLGEHRFPGAGELSLAGLVADLADNGYSGPVTLEVNPFALRFWWPPAVRRRLAQAITWLRRAAQRDLLGGL
jgi:sugar phosphate isomerase/epimerase